MLLFELAALKRLSPTLYKVRLGLLLVMGFLFLAFVGECGYLFLHQLLRPATQHAAPAAPRQR
jgi:hypothetical protein